jgi:hypothetical protein
LCMRKTLSLIQRAIAIESNNISWQRRSFFGGWDVCELTSQRVRYRIFSSARSIALRYRLDSMG